MLKIHQPYIKRKVRITFAFASIGVLLLTSGIIIASPTTHPTSHVYAAGDSRTIHDISNMQEMTQQICSNTDIGDTETLIDRRGTNISYKVIRMLDGTCWMAENLRLIDAKLTKDDSNITSEVGFIIPVSSTANFGSEMSETDGYAPHAHYSGSTTRGASYNWYTATAGAGTSSVANSDVNTSICPKGWKLPAYEGVGSFYNIINGNGTANTGYKSSWTSNGYQLGYNSDDAFFPTAGYVLNGSSLNAGFYGYYWSRRAGSSASAYSLYLDSKDVKPRNNTHRFLGSSVRCVADPEYNGDIEWQESKDGNITVTMPSIISIDATSGMDETANTAEIAEGTATASITSNAEYAVTLHSTQPSLKDITEGTTNTAEISPVSSSNSVQPGHNAWGFWDGTGDSNNKSYTLPITTAPQNLYNSKETITNTDGNPATKHTYYVGISISPALPSGTYATDVVITASTK